MIRKQKFDSLAEVILLIGRKSISVDISIELFWPDLSVTCHTLFSVTIGQLVATGYSGFPFFGFVTHRRLVTNRIYK